MSATKRYTKETVGRHSRKVTVNNPIRRFSVAYQFIQSNRGKRYITTGGRVGKLFIAEADISKGGKNKGRKVIRFKTAKTTTLAYKCCWNYQSNCCGTHIKGYTEAIR